MEYHQQFEQSSVSKLGADGLDERRPRVMTIQTLDEWLSGVAERARSGAPSDELEPLVVETALDLERQNLEDADVQVGRIIRTIRVRQDRLRQASVTDDQPE